MIEKKLTSNQSKHVMGIAMCKVLAIPVKLTRTGKMTIDMIDKLYQQGYRWFPGAKVWKKLG